MNLIGILLAIALLAMFAVACIKTAYGLLIMTLGITLLLIGYSLDLFAWSYRSIKRLMQVAFA